MMLCFRFLEVLRVIFYKINSLSRISIVKKHYFRETQTQ